MESTWKSELAPILARITACEVVPHGFVDYGRELQEETISVILDAGDSDNPMEFALFGEVRRYLKEIRSALPSGFVAYIGTTQWLQPLLAAENTYKATGIELAIGPGNTQFDILRLARTEAPNCDLATEDMITTLQSFDQELGIDIVHAEADSLSFNIIKLPVTPMLFAEKLFEFCADLSQCDVDVNDVAESLSTEETICLWWD